MILFCQYSRIANVKKDLIMIVSVVIPIVIFMIVIVDEKHTLFDLDRMEN